MIGWETHKYGSEKECEYELPLTAKAGQVNRKEFAKVDPVIFAFVQPEQLSGKTG